MQPNQPQQPTPMEQAMQQQAQPQQPTPSIDPELSKSIIDNLKQQSDQIEQAQSQIADNSDTQSQQANQILNQKRATISKALGQLNDKSVQGKVGQAMGDGSSQWANMCEAFAEQQIYGHQGIYPNAISAYKANAQAGNIDNSGNFKKGDQLFFNANQQNGFNGHTAVAINDKEFIAPLSDGSIRTFTLPQWLKYSGQSYLGAAKPSK